MKIQIAKPQEKDLEEIHNLFSIVITDTFIKEDIYFSHKEDIESEIKSQLQTFKTSLNTNGLEEYFLIAKNNEEIVGISAYGKANNIIKENSNIDLNNIPEVKSVYILPEFQNKGIGSLLFNSILTSLYQKNIENICLDSGYKQSQKFWTNKLGEPTILLKDFWDKNSHHMIWVLKLKDIDINYKLG